MKEKVLCEYKSRRNDTKLIQSPAGVYVSKQFLTKEGFRQELQIYQLLRESDLPCAQVVFACDRQILLTRLPGINLVDSLERQEQSKQPSWVVWKKLVGWLIGFYEKTGYIMTDVNLRNFLYDGESQIIYGLDFEECAQGSLFESAAKLGAFIRIYSPENTPIKQAISKYVLLLFAERCGFEPDLLFRESKKQEAILLERRKKT